MRVVYLHIYVVVCTHACGVVYIPNAFVACEHCILYTSIIIIFRLFGVVHMVLFT